MEIIAYLEKNNIATKETLQIYGACLYFYFFSLFLFQYNLSWWALSLLFITLGGMLNFYVIDSNNLSMPILVHDRKKLRQIKKQIKERSSERRACILNNKTKLKWLADRFYIGRSIYSMGDFVAFFGVVLAVLPFIVLVVLLIV